MKEKKCRDKSQASGGQYAQRDPVPAPRAQGNSHLSTVTKIAFGQVDQICNGFQWVVDFVSDCRSQTTGGSEFLCCPQGLLDFLTLGDVAGDGSRPEDIAITVFQRRDGKRDVNAGAVFVHTHGFKMVNPLAAPDLVQDHCFIAVQFRWNDQGYGTANYLFSRVAEEPLPRFYSKW